MKKSARSLIFAAAFILLISPALSMADALKAPFSIDAGIHDAYRTDVKFDHIGNAIAVFEQKKDGVFRLYANKYINGKGWAGPEIIDAGTGNAYRGKLAFDGLGNAIVVFKEAAKSGYTIYANHYLIGKGWQGPRAIDSAAGLMDGHAVAIGREDRAGVVFEKQDGNKTGIFGSLYTEESGWGAPTRIDTGNANALFPQAMFDAKGNLHVVYYKEAANGFDVYAVAYDSSKAKWLASAKIGASPAGKTEAWRNKKSIVAWDYPSEKPFLSEIKANIYSGSYYYYAWSISKVDARFRDAYTPSLVAGNDGALMAFFINWDGARLRAFNAAFSQENGWGEARIIDANAGDVEHIRAAMNSKGDVAVVFTQNTDSTLRIHSRIYSKVNGWGEARIIDAGAESSYNPSVALREDGTIVVVWCQWVRFTEEIKIQHNHMRPYDNFAVVKSFANIYRPGKGWGDASKLEDNDYETCGVRVASSPTGGVIAVFEQENDYAGATGFVNRIFALPIDVSGL